MTGRGRAFTLLEVLIATGILGGALVALLSSVHNSVRMERHATAMLYRSALARNLMTELVTRPTMDDGDRDEGDVPDGDGMTFAWRAEKVSLPFDDDAIVERRSSLIKVVLDVNDERHGLKPLRLVEYRRKDLSP